MADNRALSADVQVGNEMGGNPAAYFMSRTKRCEEYLADPMVLEHAVALAEHIDRFCEIEEIEPRHVEIDNPRYTAGGEYSELRLSR